MHTTKYDLIAEEFRNKRYAQVIRICEPLRERDPSSFNRDPWLLKHLGIAKMRRKEFGEGIGPVMEAIRLSPRPDVELWLALAETFEKIERPACAAECYSSAAVIDIEQGGRWKHRASRCLRRANSPEDIAISRVFFRISTWSPSFYETIQKRKLKINATLYRPRWADDASTFLHVLRADSSFTPIIKGTGGGYLLMYRGRGCVVDPGHGFIRNFLGKDYGFGDIHAIIVTHAHDDHIMDLPAIGSVLHKANFSQSVDLYLDETSRMALRGHFILASSSFRLQPTLMPGQRRKIFDDGVHALHVDVYRAQHKVPIVTSLRSPTLNKTKMGSGVGLGFSLGFAGGGEQYLLMPSDTGWSDAVAEQYRKLRGCDVAVLHMSSIKNDLEWIYPEADDSQYLYPQHLGLLGIIRFIQTVEPHHVLLGERGAELEEVWHDLADVVRSAFREREVVVCATKIGTKVTFDGRSVSIDGGYAGKVQP